MAKHRIPDEIKEQVLETVEDFNVEHATHYLVSFRVQYCYLSRIDFYPPQENIFRRIINKIFGITHDFVPVIETKIGRLEYTGNMDKWEFAVYKYSREAYDPQEWMFPGRGELDGTIEGALRAGYLIYP